MSTQKFLDGVALCVGIWLVIVFAALYVTMADVGWTWRLANVGSAFGAFSALIGSVALVGILITLRTENIAREHRDFQQLWAALEAARSRRQIRARNIARRARLNWILDETYRQAFLKALFADSPEALRDRFITNLKTGPKGSDDHRLAEDVEAVYTLLEYYCLLAVLPKDSGRLLKHFGLYFVAWRGFLLAVSKQYDVYYNNIKDHCGESDEAKAHMPPRQWTDLLEQLGKRLGLPEYEMEKHALDCKIQTATDSMSESEKVEFLKALNEIPTTVRRRRGN